MTTIGTENTSIMRVPNKFKKLVKKQAQKQNKTMLEILNNINQKTQKPKKSKDPFKLKW